MSTEWSEDDHINWWWDEEFGQEIDNIDLEGEGLSLLARKLKDGPFRPMSMPNSYIQIEGQIEGQSPTDVTVTTTTNTTPATTTTNVHDKSKSTINMDMPMAMGSSYRSSTNKNKSKKTKSSALVLAASKSSALSSAKARNRVPTRRRKANYGGSSVSTLEIIRAREQNIEASITNVINEGQAKNTNASATSDTKNYQNKRKRKVNSASTSSTKTKLRRRQQQDDYLSLSESTRARVEEVEDAITRVINEELTRARGEKIEDTITRVINEGLVQMSISVNEYEDIGGNLSTTTSRSMIGSSQGQDDSVEGGNPSESESTRATRVEEMEATITRVINECLVQRSINLKDYEGILGNLRPTVHLHKLRIIKKCPSNLNIEASTRRLHPYRSVVGKKWPILKHQDVKRILRTRTRSNIIISSSNITGAPLSCPSTSSNIINGPKVQDKVDKQKLSFDGKLGRGILSKLSNNKYNIMSLNGPITKKRGKNTSLFTITSITDTSDTSMIKQVEDLTNFDLQEGLSAVVEIDVRGNIKNLTDLTNHSETGGTDQNITVDTPLPSPLPSWREVSIPRIPSKFSLRRRSSFLRRSRAASEPAESDEELDETIAKRHRKYEIEEKSRIRWDNQYRRDKNNSDRLKKRSAEIEARNILRIQMRRNKTSRKICHDDPYSETKSPTTPHWIQIFGQPPLSREEIKNMLKRMWEECKSRSTLSLSAQSGP